MNKAKKDVSFLKKMRFFYIILLYLFIILWIVLDIGNITTIPQYLFLTILTASISAALCTVDAKIYGKYLSFSTQLIIFLFGIIGLLFYFIGRYKWKGLKTILLHLLIIFVLSIVIAMAVGV